jgi:hypothetical protein
LFSSDFKIRIIEAITNPDLIVHIGTERLELRPLGRCALSPPATVAPRARSRYTQHYQTVEVNSTYYPWPPKATFAFLAIAPPPRISDDCKSAPWSLRTRPHLYSPIADRIHESESQERPVFVYFNNDGEGNAVRNASGLKTFVENGTS